MKKITLFRGEFSFLSNLHPCSVAYNNNVFASVEHGYMWHKTVSRSDKNKILLIDEPIDVKRFSRTIQKVHPNWNELRYPIMYNLVLSKFSQNIELREALLLTSGFEIIEGNWWGDTYWGVCDGVGENNLGKILMKVRGILEEKYGTEF